MPVLATTAYPTGQDVFSLARAMLMDADIPSTSTIPPTGAVRATTIVTITTNAAHGLSPGDIVQVASVSDTSFNGTQTVLSTPTATTFTYVQAALPNATSGNGIVQKIVQGDVYTDAVLIPFANKAYRKVQQRLLENSSPTARNESEILNFPIGATQLSDTTSPQLPTDFLAPRTIRIRINGNPYYGSPIVQVDRIPSIQQGQANGCFLWSGDALYFLGATQANDLLLDYYTAYPDISDATGQFLIRGSQDVIADYTAFLAAQSRGASDAGTYNALFEQDMKEFLNLQAHARQFKPSRRKPNNFGRRTTVWGNWGRW